MLSKYSILGFALAAATLAGCGSSDTAQKTEAKKTSVAGSFASSEQPAATVASAPIATPPAQSTAQDAPSTPAGVIPPGQTVPVGIPQPGGVAFGPAPPNSGHDPVGDAEREQRIKDQAQLQEELARRTQQQAPTPPASEPVKRKQ